MVGDRTLMHRIAIAKTIGLLISVLLWIALPDYNPELRTNQFWGLLLWYPTMGALVGILGALDYHPHFRMPVAWWFRGPLLVGWMNFLLGMFMGSDMQLFLANLGFPGATPLDVALWLTVEGMFIGAVMDFAASHFTRAES